MENLKGKIALVTGGSDGYGKATAALLAKEGATVIIAARNLEKLQAAKEETGCAAVYSMDVTDPEAWQAIYEKIEKEYGRLDILVNNAGGGVAIKDTTELTLEEIDRTIRLNLNSVVYGCKYFSEMMKKQKAGTIINLASVCAKQSWPGWSVYAAAKAGVLQFSKGLYTELQPYQVRVTCLIPAAASTGFQRRAGLEKSDAKLDPSDIAETVRYICTLPPRAVVEEVTVWGIDQVVIPL